MMTREGQKGREKRRGERDSGKVRGETMILSLSSAALDITASNVWPQENRIYCESSGTLRKSFI